MNALPSRVDVAVIGGGTAGTIAALQAAKAGVQTALIERANQLGGTMTTGGVTFPGLFHVWGRQIIAGLGWNLVRETVQMDGGTLPDFTVSHRDKHWQDHIHINDSLYAILAEDAIIHSGIFLQYYTSPLRVQAVPHGWKLTLFSKGKQSILECSQLLDCTGDAIVVDQAGYPRLKEDEIQPGTLMFRLNGYDVENLDGDLIEERYKQALKTGELQPGDHQHTTIGFMHFLKNGGWNTQHINDADGSTAVNYTKANIAGRQSVLRLLRFVRTLPGCENTRIEKMASETGVRETFRIVGETQITVDQYQTAEQYADAVCYTYYPIDLHTAEGVFPKPLDQGVVPVIPLRALIPRGSRNLLVAGRCISSDRLANSALRVQASCMAMGQAAGAVAAIAAAAHLTPLEIDLSELKTLLRNHGAIVP